MSYDPEFLSVPVPLPRPADETSIEELPYVHFTVLLDTDKRLAAVTAVNISGKDLSRPPRNDRWRYDPRVAEEFQAGPDVYESPDLDRGHLVRRLDPVWGAPALAIQANDDTFTFPNAAPQASGFNQGKALWAGVEDHVLDYADAHDVKISVFTAPIFGPDDPLHHGVRVPRRFWKIAAWTRAAKGSHLRSVGFVLDQSAQLDRIQLEAAGRPRELLPDLGGFRTYQVPVASIASATTIGLEQLVKADRYEPSTEGVRGWVSPWKQLSSTDQIVL